MQWLLLRTELRLHFIFEMDTDRIMQMAYLRLFARMSRQVNIQTQNKG